MEVAIYSGCGVVLLVVALAAFLLYRRHQERGLLNMIDKYTRLREDEISKIWPVEVPMIRAPGQFFLKKMLAKLKAENRIGYDTIRKEFTSNRIRKLY